MPTPPYLTEPGVEVVAIAAGSGGLAHRVTVEIYAGQFDMTPALGTLSDPLFGDSAEPLREAEGSATPRFTIHSNHNGTYGDVGGYYEYDVEMYPFASLPLDAVQVSRGYRMVGRIASGSSMNGYIRGRPLGTSYPPPTGVGFSTLGSWQWTTPDWAETTSTGGVNPSLANVRAGWLAHFTSNARAFANPITTAHIDLYRYRLTYDTNTLPPEAGGLLKVRMPDGTWATVGGTSPPVKMRAPDGSWWVADDAGSGSAVAVLKLRTDTGWQDVTYLRPA